MCTDGLGELNGPRLTTHRRTSDANPRPVAPAKTEMFAVAVAMPRPYRVHTAGGAACRREEDEAEGNG
jgi:hypothetical protein